jgi:hypothetical protein
MHIPRLGTPVAIIAVGLAVVSATGVAGAATGGSFLLGKSNSANQGTVLTNTGTGPALTLHARNNTTAPLSVGKNHTKVPNLDSDYLDGLSSSSFARSGTLPSGQSESGTFSAGGSNTTGAGGYLGYGITYPRPLKTAISNANIIDALGTGPVTHCPAPGKADPGYLCLYNWVNAGVSAGYGYSSNAAPYFSSPSVGVVLYWPVTGDQPYAGGEWTVTAP